MSTDTRLITADEFLLMPDDGLRHELVRGEVTTMTLPGGEHGQIAAEMLLLIGGFAKAHRLGRAFAAETGFLIAEGPRHRPRGRCRIRAGREARAGRQSEEALALRPRSGGKDQLFPTIDPAEVLEKVHEWLAAGMRDCLRVVDPDTRTVTVHRHGAEARDLTNDQEIDGADVLPGFRCRVADVFA